MSGSFRDILKQVAKAHDLNKAVKIIRSAMYLVLNTAVQGGASADNNPAAGIASNIRQPYQEIYYYGDNKRYEV